MSCLNHSLALHMDDNTTRISACLWLGLPASADLILAINVKLAYRNHLQTHGLTCCFSAWWHHCHAAI